MCGRKDRHGLLPVPAWAGMVSLCILFLATGCSGPHEQGVIYHPKKPLEYKQDQFGNRIPDYSTAGYGNGQPIPNVPVQLELEPGKEGQDDTERLQAAIDALSDKDPDENGFRGALLLKAGAYAVSGQLRIHTSGIVLRGEGQFEEGTIVQATGSGRRSLIWIHGTDPEQDAFNRQQRNQRFRYRIQGQQSWDVVDGFAPSGREYIQVAPVKGLHVGETVILEQRMNQTWVERLGMHALPPRRDGTVAEPWDPLDFVFQFERIITAIEGGRVFFNAPLVNPVFTEFGQTRLFKPFLPNRVRHCGVENLRLVSDFLETPEQNDESHAWTGVEIGRARDCWVKGVSTVHFALAAVRTSQEAIASTVEDAAYLKPVSRMAYGRRHGFLNAGQQILFQRCFAENTSHAFVSDAGSPGPNVFLDCYASGERSIVGPWRQWAMGTLWDRTYGKQLVIRNRGSDGQNWGWSGINHLFWNGIASDWISVQSPVNGWNWAIGCQGRRLGSIYNGLVGHFGDHGKPVKPASLYIRQLEDRQGKENTHSVISQSQVSGTVVFHIRDTLSQ